MSEMGLTIGYACCGGDGEGAGSQAVLHSVTASQPEMGFWAVLHRITATEAIRRDRAGLGNKSRSFAPLTPTAADRAGRGPKRAPLRMTKYWVVAG